MVAPAPSVPPRDIDRGASGRTSLPGLACPTGATAIGLALLTAHPSVIRTDGAALRRSWRAVGPYLVHEHWWIPLSASSPPVLLVHGLGVASRALTPFAALLARDFPVYVPDQPGFGRTSHPDGTLNTVELAEFFAAWCEAGGFKRVAVFGNSFGCQIAAEFAARLLERCLALILQGPTTDPAARSRIGLIRRWVRNARREPMHIVSFGRDYARAGAGRIVSTFEAILSHKIENALPLVRAPTLVVRGSRDAIVSQKWAECVAALIPDGRWVVVPGCAHSMSQFWPLELARVVRPFLAACQWTPT